MKLLKKYILISAFILLGTAAAEETIVLQQGLNGYTGCKNLGIYDNKYPNKNYALNYTYKTARKVMISKFKC